MPPPGRPPRPTGRNEARLDAVEAGLAALEARLEEGLGELGRAAGEAVDSGLQAFGSLGELRRQGQALASEVAKLRAEVAALADRDATRGAPGSGDPARGQASGGTPDRDDTRGAEGRSPDRDEKDHRDEKIDAAIHDIKSSIAGIRDRLGAVERRHGLLRSG